MRPYILLTPGPLTTTDSVKQTMMADWCTWDEDYNVGIVEEVRRGLVEGMRSLGFETLLPDAIQSPIITSFLYPHAGFDFKDFYAQLKAQGFVIYPGKISQADTFRIGNIGDVHPDDFRRLIEAVRGCRY